MTSNRLFILLFLHWILSVGLGFFAARNSDSALIGALVSWGTVVVPVILFSSGVNAAWWSVNAEEAGKAGFVAEATTSLKFVIGLTLFMGGCGLLQSWYNNDYLYGAVSGSFLAHAMLATLRLRALSARKIQ